MRRLLLALVIAVAAAAPAQAAIDLGVQDDPLIVRLPTAFAGFGADRLLPPARVEAALDSLGVDVVRINVPSAQVEGDPARLALFDAAVDRQIAAGRRVQLTLSGPARKPDPRRYARFAGAMARHFRGRVTRYAIWNEPNWWSLLRPRKRNARAYRRIFLRGAAAIRRADPRAKVLIGELAPLGQPEAATPPLRFLRRLTCSDRRWRATRRCPRLVADGFAHHPYTLRWAPDYPGPGRDDVTMGSLRRLTRALDKLARRGVLVTPGRRRMPLYLTEWGYHARSARVREPLRSRYVRRGLELAAKVRRVREVVWYQLAGPPPSARVHWDTGLLDFRGRPRPVFRAVRSWSRKRRSPVVALPAASRPPGRFVPDVRLRSYATPPVAGGPALAWTQGSRVRLSWLRGGRFRRGHWVARSGA